MLCVDALEYFRKKNPFDAFDEETRKSSDLLWADKGFQKLWAQRDTIPNFSIMHLDYLMTHIERVTKDEQPTTEDVLYARKRTTGTNEIEFNVRLRRSLASSRRVSWLLF